MKAGAIYGFYTAMVYLLCLGGGWVADRITGQRRAVLYGGVLIAAGNFCLAAPSLMVFYVGLGLMMLGTGMLKPNVSVIVGQLYGPRRRRRDSGFSIFYMGINLGALISPIICGLVGEKISWRLGFAVSGIGMVAGMIQYWWGRNISAMPACIPPHRATRRATAPRSATAVIAGAVALASLLVLVALNSAGTIEITPTAISDGLGWVLLAISAVAFYWLIFGKGWSAKSASGRWRFWCCSSPKPFFGRHSNRPARRSISLANGIRTGCCSAINFRRVGFNRCSRSS